jgi:hypothetical protein
MCRRKRGEFRACVVVFKSDEERDRELLVIVFIDLSFLEAASKIMAIYIQFGATMARLEPFNSET